MGKIDMIGSEDPIGGGNTEELDSFTGGTVQFLGEKMDLSRTLRPVGNFTDQSMGDLQRDFTGTVPLSRQPHRGYESGTPINAQAKAPTGS